MEEPQQEPEEYATKELRLAWHMPDTVKTQYATHFAVQLRQYDFAFLFFELQQPLLIGEPENIQAIMEGMDSVPVEGFARIVLPPSLIPKVIDALQQKYEQYLEREEVVSDDN